MFPLCIDRYMISQLLTKKKNLFIPNISPTYTQPREVRDAHSKHLRELPFANIASQSSQPSFLFLFLFFNMPWWAQAAWDPVLKDNSAAAASIIRRLFLIDASGTNCKAQPECVGGWK